MPDWSDLIRSRLSNLAKDPVREAEIVQEMAAFLEDRYEEAVGSGMAPAEAARQVISEFERAPAATLEFRVADRTRAPVLPPSPGGSLWRGVSGDVLYAFRLLRRRPAFSLFSILVLALGIAAGAAVFTVVDAVLLRPLPYPDPDRLVLIGHGSDSTRPGTLGFATFDDWRQLSQSFTGLATIRSWSPILRQDEGARGLTGVRVSASYFSVLGVKPAIGRDFESREDHPDTGQVVILSHELWRDRFGSDPSAVGRSVQLNGRAYQIIGVLESGYRDIPSTHLYQKAEIFAPLAYDATLPWACRGCQHLQAMGRLRPEASVAKARQELEAILSKLKHQYSDEYAKSDRASVVGLHDDITRSARPALSILSGAVLLVLLISCANVANLLFARGVHRRREIGLRSALGADSLRLTRQILIENVILGVAAGTLGVLLTLEIVRVLWALAPAELSQIGPLEAGSTLIWFGPLLALVTSVLAGLVPALATGGGNLSSVLRSSRQASSRGVGRAQRVIVVADVALALVLLTGALLMLQTFRNLIAVDPGFDPRNRYACRVSIVGDLFPDDTAVWNATDALLERLGGIPGITAAAAASQVPQGGNWDSWGIHRQDRLETNPADAPSAQLYAVTAGYFDVMKIPVVKGRAFRPSDRAGTLPVMIVGQGTAERFWPGEDPIGKRVRVGASDDGPWITVVGIAGEVLHRGLETRPGLQVYLPLAQRPSPFPTFVLETGGSLTGLAEQVKFEVSQVSRDIPLQAISTMEQYLEAATSDRRFVMWLMVAFAVVAILLTAAGIYSLASYFVLQRTHELAIRMALGAEFLQVVLLVLGGGIRMASVGAFGGLAVAVAVSGWMQSLLFQIQPLDGFALTGACAFIFLVVLTAHLLPVRRALAIHPARALRAE